MGFVHLDFGHLVDRHNLPWYSAYDHLYRPLRNGFFRLAPGLLGTDPEPYRLLMWAGYAACGMLLYRLGRRLELSRIASVAAIALALFSPRNHELLFSLATFQDLVSSAFLLGMILCWIIYRERNRAGWLTCAAGCWGLALGFKETACIGPVLLLLVDWYRGESIRRGWRAYSAFVLPGIAYAAFVWWLPDGQFRIGIEAQVRNYRATTATGTAIAEVRSVLHLITPFSELFTLGEASRAWLALASSGATLGLLFVVARRRRIWLLSAAWVAVTLLPTSIFARFLPADHYYFLAGCGLAMCVAARLEDVHKMRPQLGWWMVLIGVSIYTAAGWRVLVERRTTWTSRAAKTMELLEQIEQMVPKTAPVHIQLANTDMEFSARTLYGALVWRGYPRELVVSVNPATAPGDLRTQLQNCIPGDALAGEYVLWMDGVSVINKTGACGQAIVTSDQQQRPRAWQRVKQGGQ